MQARTIFLDQGETLGGAERFLLDFFSVLSAQELKKVNPLILGAKNPKYQEALCGRIPFEKFDTPSLKDRGLKTPFTAWKLFQSAREVSHRADQLNAEIIFTNTPRAIFVLLLAKKFLRIPQKWVLMIHDFSIPKIILKEVARYADIFIVNSLASRRYAHEVLDEKYFEKIRIIENFINFQDLPNPPAPTFIKNILLLGRIDPQKGQMYALEAAEILKRKHIDVSFSIVGSPFEQDLRTVEYAEKVFAFARERNLTNVRFYPEVPSPFEVMSKADLVLALPTKPETFGRIVVEAMALNRLVICFDETGPREILQAYEAFLNAKNPRGGSHLGLDKIISTQQILVEKQNSEALAGAIQFFVNNPGKISDFTRFSRAFVEKNFEANDVKKKMMYALLG